MTIKLRGEIGVENVSAGILCGGVEKHRAPFNIFQCKYSVSITYLYNIFLLTGGKYGYDYYRRYR